MDIYFLQTLLHLEYITLLLNIVVTTRLEYMELVLDSPLLTSKAGTLENLKGLLTKSKILEQQCIRYELWKQGQSQIISDLREKFGCQLLVVRSSHYSEDTAYNSMAGKFLSILNVKTDAHLVKSISDVFKSYTTLELDDEVLIQPMLQDVKVSGVAFTQDPNTGGHYYILSYDDKTGNTDTVTSGKTNDIKTLIIDKSCQLTENHDWYQVLIALEEIQNILRMESLDVEFAINGNGEIYIFQVRPLCKVSLPEISIQEQKHILNIISQRFSFLAQEHPYIYGEKFALGIMPDWNPAEIIGQRPYPLALSLYKELVTDNIWAYQRDNYGYRNLRSFPLMVDLAGQPYINVKVSFNSFIPKDLSNILAEKLANIYLDKFVEDPKRHDKIEFDIVLSCYTFDMNSKLIDFKNRGLSEIELLEFKNSLRSLTNRVIHGNEGLWRIELEKLEELERRFETIKSSKLDLLSKIYWVLEDCKRYGTLPFAGLARAGFIAVQLLQSLIDEGYLSPEEGHDFFSSIHTVTSKLKLDLAILSVSEFLIKYGHLRPGTYDIYSPRYDQKFETYFSTETKNGKDVNHAQLIAFNLPSEKIDKINKLLKKNDIDHDAESLFNFFRSAIEGREYAKFIFTKSLSFAIELVRELACENQVHIEDLGYINIKDVVSAYSEISDVSKMLNYSILKGKESHRVTRALVLPPVILNSDDIFSFMMPQDRANFVGGKSIIGNVAQLDLILDKSQIRNSIVMIPSADPGYDWIFSHDIIGLVTMFGGANSHMAIRARETGIAAVIGTGEFLYKKLSMAKVLEIDCINKQVNIIS